MLYLIDNSIIEWLQTKRPIFADGRYSWQCAYPDAKNSHYIIPSYVYDEIYPWYAYSPPELVKSFKTYTQAMKAFNKAVHIALKKEVKFSLDKFPKGWL